VKKKSDTKIRTKVGAGQVKAPSFSCAVNVHVDAARIVRDTYRFAVCLIVLFSGGGGVSFALRFAYSHLMK
jgi:hypothetical protein